MKLGSEEHKQLFCQDFINSHLPYEPETMAFPELNETELDRLRRIPFWQIALSTEREAGMMVSAMAETIDDPEIRAAIALQGEEESRHARLIECLIRHYDLQVEEPPTPVLPKNVRLAFTDFGFEECLDSFFAFGMFGLAREANYLPESMFTLFDPILDEEARHIVFFINWITYVQAQNGRANLFRGAHSALHYGRALFNMGKMVLTTDGNSGGFTATGAKTFVDDLTLPQFLSATIRENQKRMSKFDDRLLEPRLLPRLASIALKATTLLPKRANEMKVEASS
ncbi:ferritin-like domain-containing protein [Pseudanabaenaceae cyanobacterium LEGE 13415]|nr:ferritin-like domain-containing protein [Pseudanabaenaceae cyanobacterium LEGE 13415]